MEKEFRRVEDWGNNPAMPQPKRPGLNKDKFWLAVLREKARMAVN
jgi:hypothetical protein